MKGRSVQVTLYGPSPDSFMEPTREVFQELEADYGPWPHGHLLIYAIPKYSGGMEYSGATVTGLRALGHEMHHSYFARSTFPMGGNAGWFEEEISEFCSKDVSRLFSEFVYGNGLQGASRHSTNKKPTSKFHWPLSEEELMSLL